MTKDQAIHQLQDELTELRATYTAHPDMRPVLLGKIQQIEAQLARAIGPMRESEDRIAGDLYEDHSDWGRAMIWLYIVGFVGILVYLVTLYLE